MDLKYEIGLTESVGSENGVLIWPVDILLTLSVHSFLCEYKYFFVNFYICIEIYNWRAVPMRCKLLMDTLS